MFPTTPVGHCISEQINIELYCQYSVLITHLWSGRPRHLPNRPGKELPLDNRMNVEQVRVESFLTMSTIKCQKLVKVIARMLLVYVLMN